MMLPKQVRPGSCPKCGWSVKDCNCVGTPTGDRNRQAAKRMLDDMTRRNKR